MRVLRVFILAATLTVLTTSSLVAATPSSPSDINPSVEDLIQQLDSPKFEERRRASESLFDMGPEAFQQLATAAKGDSREVTERAIEILRRQFQSQDDETKTAAQQALEGLASSEGSRVGRAAKQALQGDEPQQRPNPAQLARLQRAFPPQFRQRMQLLPPAGPNGQFARRTKVQVINGLKTIEVDYGNKKIKVEETADGKIKATTTETINGQLRMKTIEAKNADDLKQKDAEAHKVYDSLGQRVMGGVRIVQNNGAAPPNLPQPPNNMKQMWGQTYDRLIKSLEDQKQRMKERLGDPQQAEHLKRILDSLDQQIERIREQKKRIEAQP